MNSFFGEDTTEEEKLIEKIVKQKDEENKKKLPQMINEILTSHLIQTTTITPKNELVSQVKKEVISEKEKNNLKENKEIVDIYSIEEKLNMDVKVHIFSFHLKKNGRINADLYFIPYKSKDGKDIITEYTYSYGYYDIYSENVEKINKSIHQRRIDDDSNKMIKNNIEGKNEKIDNVTNDGKTVKVKTEQINVQENKQKDQQQNHPNFQKWLVHFRGRLFIGCEVNYSYFGITTFLATIQDRNIKDKSIEGLNMFHRKIQTYNIIKNATYWKQDSYPDISDQNIQKLLFFLLVPPLNEIEKENEIDDSPIVF